MIGQGWVGGERLKLIQGRDDNIIPSGYPGLSFTFGEACRDAPPLQMLGHAAQITGISFLLSEKLTHCFGVRRDWWTGRRTELLYLSSYRCQAKWHVEWNSSLEVVLQTTKGSPEVG